MAETAERISVTLVPAVGFVFEIGSHYVAPDGLELAKLTRLTSSSSQVLRLKGCVTMPASMFLILKKINFYLVPEW